MKPRLRISILLLGICLIAACATIGPTATGKPLTAKQQATVWLSDYNSVSANVKAIANSQTSTPEQLDVARKELAIMKQVYPLLKTYSSLVDSGGTPTAQDIKTITNLMAQLAALVGSK